MEIPEHGRNRLNGSQSVNRALDILDQIIKGPARPSELARMTGVSPSTMHRLLNALIHREYIRRTPAGFTLGLKLLSMGTVAAEQIDYVGIARPFVRQLNIDTRFTILLTQREGDWACHLDRIDGVHRLQVAAAIGERFPIHAIGSGRALLFDERQGSDIVAGHGSERLIDTGHGTAILFDTGDPDGIRSIACPIRGAGGAIQFAIGIESASHYLPDALCPILAEKISLTAERIGATLGYSAPRKG